MPNKYADRRFLPTPSRPPSASDSIFANRCGQSGRRGRLLLLGVAHDSGDGHLRLTQSDHYRLAGGTSQSHETMRRYADVLLAELREQGFHPETIAFEDVPFVKKWVHERLSSLMANPAK